MSETNDRLRTNIRTRCAQLEAELPWYNTAAVADATGWSATYWRAIKSTPGDVGLLMLSRLSQLLAVPMADMLGCTADVIRHPVPAHRWLDSYDADSRNGWKP